MSPILEVWMMLLVMRFSPARSGKLDLMIHMSPF